MSTPITTKQLPPPEPSKDAKWCHRFMVPLSYGVQRVNPLNPREPIMEPAGNMIYTKCIAEQCAIWDERGRRCGDLTHALATAELANATERIAKITEKEHSQVKFIESGA